MRRFVSFFGERTSVFENLNRRAQEYAAQKGFEYVWAPQTPFDREDVIARLREADAGLIDVQPYGEDVFSRIGSRCRLLIRFGVGYDQVNLSDASRYGVCIARTAGANANAVAEMVVAMTLALYRRLRKNQRAVESGQWEKNVGYELRGKTVGIVGFGAVGRALSKLLRGFDARILAYDPFADAQNLADCGAEKCELNDLVREADVISIHTPYTPQTHMLFDAERISQMKKTAILICTARGGIVDEDALYQALSKGTIAGAGLDVFAEEPLPVSSKLLRLENVILTPHVASQTEEALWNIYRRAIDLADDFFAGRQMDGRDLLNPECRNA